jgi:hypothetical protein
MDKEIMVGSNVKLLAYVLSPQRLRSPFRVKYKGIVEERSQQVRTYKLLGSGDFDHMDIVHFCAFRC